MKWGWNIYDDNLSEIRFEGLFGIVGWSRSMIYSMVGSFDIELGLNACD